MKIIILIFASLLISSCTNDIKENQELRNELRSREIELSSVQGTPGYKLGQALEYANNGDYPEAVQWLDDLQNNFPDWNKEIVLSIKKNIITKLDSSKF